MVIFYNVNTLLSDIEMIEMNFDARQLNAFVTAGVLNLITTGVSYYTIIVIVRVIINLRKWKSVMQTYSFWTF